MAKVKDKERILKAVRDRQLVTYMGASLRLSADFSTETLQVRGTKNDENQGLRYPVLLAKMET